MIRYRAPTLADMLPLAELGRTSFVDAFAHLYSTEDLEQFLRESKSDDVVAGQLANPKFIFHIAERDGDMVGFCKLGLESSFTVDLGGRKAMELANLYLRGAETGGGVGSALLEWAISEARARDYDMIVLSVWQGNHAAQRFYRRYGFEWLMDTVFIVGKQVDQEFLFALDLRR